MCYSSQIVVDGKTFHVHECGGVTVQQTAPVQAPAVRGQWDRSKRKLAVTNLPENVVKAVEANLATAGR